VVLTELIAVPFSRARSERADRFSAARLMILLFLVAQSWDGIFTYVAVTTYGIGAEGNSIIATWMHLVGPVPALIGAKVLASLCGVLLYVRHVHYALAAVTLIYAVSALGPWLMIYSSM
jgi:hypothetical protein